MKVLSKKIAYELIFIIIVFNSIIEQYIKIFIYFDEFLALICLLYIIFKNKLKIKKTYFNIFIYSLIIIFIGLLGNVIWGYNANVVVVIKDLIAFIKMPITIIAVTMWNDKNSNDFALEIAYKLSKLIIRVFFICAIISMFINIGMTHDMRRGINSFKFLYPHPTFLVYSVVVMSVVLTAHGIKKRDIILHLEAIVILILSMRDKAFGYVLLFVVLIVVFPNIKKIKFRYLFIIAIGIFGISYEKIKEYMSYSWSPRFALYTSGFTIMKKCFPIGSGFGTFASSLSGEYYSKLYSLYGFSNREGVNASNYVNLGDAQWPYYFAQFGIFGIILFVSIMIILCKLIISRYQIQRWKLKASLLLIGYMIIGSFVENVFTNESGVTSIIILFMFLGKRDQESLGRG